MQHRTGIDRVATRIKVKNTEERARCATGGVSDAIAARHLATGLFLKKIPGVTDSED